MIRQTPVQPSERSGAVAMARRLPLTRDQRVLEASYVLHLRRSPAFLRRVLLWDIGAAADLGAEKLTDDLHAVLHHILIEYAGAFGVATDPERGPPACNA